MTAEQFARARNMTALAQKVGMIPTRASAPDRVRSGGIFQPSDENS